MTQANQISTNNNGQLPTRATVHPFYDRQGFCLFPQTDKRPLGWTRFVLTAAAVRKIVETQGYPRYGFIIPPELMVIDVDRHGTVDGMETLLRLSRDVGVDLLEICGHVARTGRDGRHLIFGLPGGAEMFTVETVFEKDAEGNFLKNEKGKKVSRYPGIDFWRSQPRDERGFPTGVRNIVGAGSLPNVALGQTHLYEFLKCAEGNLVCLPQAVIDLVKTEKVRSTCIKTVQQIGDSPIDRFNSTSEGLDYLINAMTEMKYTVWMSGDRFAFNHPGKGSASEQSGFAGHVSGSGRYQVTNFSSEDDYLPPHTDERSITIGHALALLRGKDDSGIITEIVGAGFTKSAQEMFGGVAAEVIDFDADQIINNVSHIGYNSDPGADLLTRATMAYRFGKKFVRENYGGKEKGWPSTPTEYDWLLYQSLIAYNATSAGQLIIAAIDKGSAMDSESPGLSFEADRLNTCITFGKTIPGEGLIAPWHGESWNDCWRLARRVLYAHGWKPTDMGKDRTDCTIRFYLGQWWQYLDGCYRRIPDPQSLVGRIVEEVKADIGSSKGHRAKSLAQTSKDKVASTLAAMVAVLPTIDSQETALWLDDEGRHDPGRIVPCKNGLLLLHETAEPELIPPTHRYFCTYWIECDYDPTAKCPTFDLAMNRWWPTDDLARWLLLQWIGYCLTNDTRLNVWMMLIGKPRSGKGTLRLILGALLGEDNCASAKLTHWEKDHHATESCWNKALVTFPDERTKLQSGGMMNALETILSWTGGDKIHINPKGQPGFDVYPKGKLMLLANRLPDLRDPDGAMQSRLLLLSMPNSFVASPAKDPDLVDKLKAELSGILNRSIAGLRNLWANSGQFAVPSEIAKLKADAERHSRPVKAFLEEVRSIHRKHWADTQTLMAAFGWWVEHHAVHTTISERHVMSEIYRVDGLYRHRMQVGDQRQWGVAGVELRQDVVAEIRPI